MKRLNSIHALLAALFIFLVGFYAADLDSPDKATVFSLPDFTATTDIKPANQQPVQTLQEFNDAIVNIADETKPTVVTIRVTQTVKMQPNPFSRFFGDPRGEQPREFQQSGLGSGVIVSQDGYILTNNHVVQDADEITVGLLGGREYKGQVVGTDPQTDIAVVKIDPNENLPAIQIGNSDNVRVGELTLAIGSPLGENLAHSISMGIISAKERSLEILADVGGYEKFIQTDAAINPGNSGGALVNMDGELIGINTAIASRSGGNEGIGFAVPSNLAQSIMKSLIEDGKVVRGFLGITFGGNVDATMARALGLDQSYGVIIGGVTEGGPADQAGLREGDVIQTINGDNVENWTRFRTEIGTSAPGTEITLGISRDGESRNITLELGESSSDEVASAQTPDRDMNESLGFNVENLTGNLAQRLGLEPGQTGVVVTSVNQGSNAYQQGLRRGDVIIGVGKGQTQVSNTRDFRNAIRSAMQEDDSVILLQVLRQGTKQYVAFEL